MIFWTKFAQNVFPVLIRKSEHHHWILHLRISLGTKLQLKLTSSIFRTKFFQKGSFRSKTEKSHLCMCPWLLLAILNFSTWYNNGILMSLLLLVAETINYWHNQNKMQQIYFICICNIIWINAFKSGLSKIFKGCLPHSICFEVKPHFQYVYQLLFYVWYRSIGT